MKRVYFVAAVAALTGSAAFAQSSVTIYGRLNVTAEYEKVGDQKGSKAINDNASRLGFLGVEDLGGGMKAGFQIEHRFDPSTGNVVPSVNDGDVTFWNGQSEVNLSGSWGMIRAGMFTAESYYATADYTSMHNHDTGTSEDKLYTGVGKISNRVSYRTPEMFGGLTGEVAVSEGNGDPRTYDLALNYTHGSLHVGAGYTKFGDDWQTALQGYYEFGAFTLAGYVQRDEVASDSRNSFRIAGRYTLGNSEFHLNFGVAGDRGDTNNTDANQFTAAYNYNLSKRTKVYLYYTHVDNEAAASYFPVGSRSGAEVGDNFNSYAVGMRHNF